MASVKHLSDIRIEGNLYLDNVDTNTNSESTILVLNGSTNEVEKRELPADSGAFQEIDVSAGQVAFGDGTGLNGDGHFYWDSTNNRLGIGTTSPAADLHIEDAGNATSGLRFSAVGTGNQDNVNMHFQGTAGSAPFYISRASTGGAEIQIQRDGDLILNGTNGDNVGVGTTSPQQKLDVNGHLLVRNHIYLNSGTSNSIVGVGGGIEFYSNSQKRMDITFGGDVQIFEDLRIGGSSGPTLSKNANSALQIGNGSASIAHILTTGGSTALSQLLVGNTGGSNPSPAPAIFEALNTAGNNQVANITQQEDSNSSTTSECLRLKHDGVNDGNFGLMITFRDSNSVIKGKISSTSTSTTYSTSSDQRLKEDEKDFDGLNLVSQMKPYDFKWKEDGSRDYGMFAQELVNVIPNAVDVPTKEDGVTIDEEEHYFADYSKLVPVLVKAVQELEAKVKILENK